MDRKQFLEQLAAPAGGKENIGLCDFRSGCLSVTVKDRSVIDLNAIRGLPGVADAELLRSRLRITPDQTIMEELQMAKKERLRRIGKTDTQPGGRCRKREQRHPLCHPSAL